MKHGNKVEIIPALLVRSRAELEQGLLRLRGVTSWVQVDLVGDNYLEKEEYFPLWEEFSFEADLMLANQAKAAEAMVALGAARVVVHAAGEGARAALEALQQYRAGDFAVEAGIALRSHDAPEALQEFEGLYDYVQVMGIDHEGRQGEPPDPHGKTIELIKALRSPYPALIIQVDGGVSVENARTLAEAGANRLIAGSAILAQDDPKAAYKHLLGRVN
ncbi:MAG TPA: hypothetical protein VJJ20_03710 [Candidatus Paceibacterota bacterium]